MATCKDCLHVDVCEDITRHKLSPSRAKEISPILREHGKTCEQFKDRSRFVELPCKVGDKIYFAKKRNYKYATITDVFVRREDTYFTWRASYYDYDREFRMVEFVETGTFIQSDIGRTIFFTREEAEQALASKNQPDNTPQ